ncbi:hypothetical protein FISHEDRAFT_70683 [Fistulina hepatica ATCC 64428]|uniref:F-box domain-containing protein n=1 Tax=Fistulina hepatica ATCC 64428 TaxID=1128425 RepID=A0A0D7AIP2_9AGAR|nr:hypothetical protein FISHEDRAFT_70683 [Fistulina hepatica ATCC 64428]
MLQEVCLHSFPMSQFFSQEQVPALRALQIYECQIELHAMQPILLQITNLDLRFDSRSSVDLDFHALLSYAPVLSQLTVYSDLGRTSSYMSRIQSDTRSRVLLSHLRRLHLEQSIFILDIITAPNLVHLHLEGYSLHSKVVDAFLRRSQCNIESLHLDIGYNSIASSIIELWRQMPHSVTHLAISNVGRMIWVPFEERTTDGRFSMFPQLRHFELQDLELGGSERNRVPLSRAVSEIMRVVLKRCGARKTRVRGRTGYRRSKTPPVLRRVDICCPLTRLQRRTLSVLSQCGALDVCFSVSGRPARNADSDYDGDDSDSEEEDSSDDSDNEEDSSGGDDDDVVYI